MKGSKKTIEHTKNIRLAKLGSSNPMYGKQHKKLLCPVCNKEIVVTIKRLHFDNCKYKNSQQPID